MFKKVLIANRGEIAVRIMRTCREMGIHTVAVYSEVDAKAAHVLEADEAILLGDPEPSKSYLNIDRVITAAQSTGAEAIHPGYGFLAENPDFAEACEASGINFIGPPSNVIRDLGNKTLARGIMETAGLPVIPGMPEATTDLSVLCREARQIGFPVLVKAVAGGGGKGMRIVSDQDEMQEACVSAMSEAEKAFGDGSLYLEKRLETPRHIEFQILADKHGNVHLIYLEGESIDQWELLYRQYSHAASSWSDSMTLASMTVPKTVYGPKIICDQLNNLHVVWLVVSTESPDGIDLL